MFQTIMKLYDTSTKGKYIYFGASIIYCNENNVCMVYYNPVDSVEHPIISPTDTTMIVSSSS
jgi:hypothetical protein